MTDTNIDQLTPGPSGPRVRRGLAIGGAAAALVIIVGIGFWALPLGDGPEPGPVSSLEDFAGTYENVGSGGQFYLHILEDGTLHLSSNRDLVEDRPEIIEETRFEGTKVFLKNTKGVCVDEDAIADAIYEIQLLENGNLKFVAIEDTCGGRSGGLQIGEYAPVP